ncbi:hypothetical protein ScPMuIL_004577 [Solemya velum]
MSSLEVRNGCVIVPERDYYRLHRRAGNLGNLHMLIQEKELENKNLTKRCNDLWSYHVSTHTLLAKRTKDINKLINTIRTRRCPTCGEEPYREFQQFQSITSLPDSPLDPRIARMSVESEESVFQGHPASTKEENSREELEVDCAPVQSITNTSSADDKNRTVRAEDKSETQMWRPLDVHRPSSGSVDSGIASWRSGRQAVGKIGSQTGQKSDSVWRELTDNVSSPNGVSERYFNNVVSELSRTKQWLHDLLKKNNTDLGTFMEAKKAQTQIELMRRDAARFSEEVETLRKENRNLKLFSSNVLKNSVGQSVQKVGAPNLIWLARDICRNENVEDKNSKDEKSGVMYDSAKDEITSVPPRESQKSDKTDVSHKTLDRSTDVSHKSVDRSTSHKSVDRSTGVSHRTLDGSTDVSDKSVDRSTDVSHKSVDRSTDVSHKSVDRSTDVSHKSVDRSTSHKSVDRSTSHKSVDRSTSHKSVDRSTSHKSVDRSTDVSHRTLDGSTDVSDKSVDRLAGVSYKSVDTSTGVFDGNVERLGVSCDKHLEGLECDSGEKSSQPLADVSCINSGDRMTWDDKTGDNQNSRRNVTGTTENGNGEIALPTAKCQTLDDVKEGRQFNQNRDNRINAEIEEPQIESSSADSKLRNKCLEQEAITHLLLIELDNVKAECKYLQVQKEVLSSHYDELLKTMEEMEKRPSRVLQREKDKLETEMFQLKQELKEKHEEVMIVVSSVDAVQEDLEQERQRNILLEATLTEERKQHEAAKAELVAMYAELRNKMNILLFENAQRQYSYPVTHMVSQNTHKPQHRHIQLERADGYRTSSVADAVPVLSVRAPSESSNDSTIKLPRHPDLSCDSSSTATEPKLLEMFVVDRMASNVFLILCLCVLCCIGDSNESEFDIGSILDTIGRTADSVLDLLTDSNDCGFECPRGQTPVPRVGHRPSANGCGAHGFKLDTSLLPPMTECCNEHDRCYDTCNSNKLLCDEEFHGCLTDMCADLLYELTDDQYDGCTGVVDLMYATTLALGCKPYRKSQKEACVCKTDNSMPPKGKTEKSRWKKSKYQDEL